MDADGLSLLTIVLMALCLALSILYAAGSSAVDFLSQAQVRREAEEGDAKAQKLIKLLNWQKAAVTPLQAGQLLFGALGFAFCLYSFEVPVEGLENGNLRRLLAILILTAAYLLVFFLLGDLLPKKGARNNALGFATRMAGPLCALHTLAFPFLKLCATIANGILRLCRIDPHILDDLVTEEEILQMVGEGEEKGVIEETERDMITNILDFKDTTAEETMTHRTDIIAVEDSASIAEVVEASVENGCSRIPVYHEDIDTVVGICYIKDLLPYVGRPVPEFIKITDLMRPAYFVPETKKCSQLFTEMTERKVQIAIIVDEYGGTEGLITMEDLLESIVGNIQDEYDHEEEEIRKLAENKFTVDGITPIDEIEDLVGVELPETEYDTIAGLVMERLGRIPSPGEHPSVSIPPLTLTVGAVSDRRITKILIEKKVPAPQPEEEENRKDDSRGRKGQRD